MIFISNLFTARLFYIVSHLTYVKYVIFYEVFSMTCARSKLVVFAHFMASVICR